MPMQTRRGAPQMGMTALAANTAASVQPATHVAAAETADAELIQACRQWQAVDRALEALYETRDTIEIEEQTQPEVDRFRSHQLDLESRIGVLLPPKTKQGATVIAKLALDTADKWNGNYHCLRDVCNHMAWDALAFLCRADGPGICCMAGTLGESRCPKR